MVRMTLQVEGMSCGMCEAHVNDAVRRAVRTKKVSSSHKKGLTEILAEEAPDETAVRLAIEATGYRVLSVHTEPYEKKGFFSFGR